jgi:hypothetical protein
VTWQHNESLFAPLVTRLQKRPAALNNLLFHLLHWRQLRIGRRRFTQISLCLQVCMTAWHEHDGGRQAQAACPRTHQFHSMALAGARTHGQACSPVRAHTTPPSGPVRGPPPLPAPDSVQLDARTHHLQKKKKKNLQFHGSTSTRRRNQWTTRPRGSLSHSYSGVVEHPHYSARSNLGVTCF